MSELDLFVLSVCGAVGLFALGMKAEQYEIGPRLFRWVHGRREVKLRVRLTFAPQAFDAGIKKALAASERFYRRPNGGRS